jgi:hypothetical protein
LNAHEKQTRVVVVVLRGFFNVAAAFQQKARDSVHDARSVGAGERENKCVIHGRHCRRDGPTLPKLEVWRVYTGHLMNF